MKKIQRVKSFFSGLMSWLDKTPVCFVVTWSFLLNLLVEIFSRHSLIQAFVNIFTSFGVFAFNTLVVFAFCSLSLLFKRRFFALTMFSLPFALLGLINFIVLCCRNTPLSANDFLDVIKQVSIVNRYFNFFVILLLALVVAAIIVGFVFFYKKSSFKPRLCKKSVFSCFSALLIISVLLPVFFKFGVLSTKFVHLPDDYKKYGFNYSFICSFFTGISKPEEYSPQLMEEIMNEIGATDDKTVYQKPNIIFLQLESFFDVGHINSAYFSEDPTPFFNSLKEEHPYGFLTVPYVGAGTANVEFEVLTGMSLEFFGPGEYPYKTILQTTTCESLAFNLKELGYSSHAVHNHKGMFYDRAHVFSNLGFDTYTSVEFMQDVKYNPVGWACDDVLVESVFDCLDYTEGQDFVFTITVQSHGIYPTAPPDGWTPVIDVTVTDGETLLNENSLEYYASQLRHTDNVLEELIGKLSERDEDTVVVMYGDHLPYLKLLPEELENESIYQTEYIIWSNFGLENGKEARDLYSYELSSEVLSYLGMNNGIITKLHQSCAAHEHYLEYLETLEYDMLYGNRDCYGNKNKYSPSEIVMGIHPPEIGSVYNTEEGAYVTGEAFTEASTVIINKDEYKTEFIDNNTLFVPKLEVIYGDRVSVAQIGNKRILRESEKFVADETVNPPPYDNPFISQ